MTALGELVAYNAWANARTFDACARVAPDARGEGVTRSLFDLLQHITGTEDGYLHLLRGDLEQTLEERRAWYASLGGDIAPLRQRSATLARAYGELLGADAEALARRVRIPWLEVEASVAEALLQAVTHSIQHRADVSTILTQHGATAPKLDFVFWVAEGRP